MSSASHAERSRSRSGLVASCLVAAMLSLGAATTPAGLDAALAAYKAGDYRKAAQLAEAAVKASPDVPGYLLLGKALMRTDKLDDALSAFASAIKEDAKVEGAHFFRGTILAKQGKRTEAEKELLAELQVSPRSAQTLFSLAMVRREMGKREASAQSFLRCLEIDEDNLVARKLLIATDVELERANDAAFQLAKLKKSDEDFAPFSYNVARLFFKKKQDARAAAILRTAIAANPSFAKTHYLLGLTLARQNKREEAKKEIEEYLRLDPQGAEAADARKVLASLG